MDILAQLVLTVLLQVLVSCTGKQCVHMEVFLVLEKCMSFNIISSPEPKAHR